MEKSFHWSEFVPVFIVMAVTVLLPFYFAYPLQLIFPPLGLGMLCYWLSQHKIPIWGVLLCGLLLDFSHMLPLGVGISALLLLTILIRPEGNILKFTKFIWSSALAMGWIYLLVSLVEGQFFPPSAPIFQWALLVSVFPLISYVCSGIDRLMARFVPAGSMR